jgi:hypothetical protein
MPLLASATAQFDPRPPAPAIPARNLLSSDSISENLIEEEPKFNNYKYTI